MKTLVLKAHPKQPINAIKKAAAILKQNGLVAMPTETVYGLAANALNPKAVKKIFKAKGRPSDNPLIVHVADRKTAARLVSHIPEPALKLMRKFWPGPLTIVLKKSAAVPGIISGGLPTVALRMPKNKIALALIHAAGFPLAAPSANVSGRPSPTSAAHVLEDLDGKIDCILDGGATRVGIESTVIDLSGKIPTLLRPGKISAEALRAVLGPVRIASSRSKRPKSPGMKYRHYAPKAQLTIVEGKPEKIAATIQSLLQQKKKSKTGVLTTQPRRRYRHAKVFFVGATPSAMARNLFKVFREMDRLGVEQIYAEGIGEKGLGRAVMNRLRKAAGYRVIRAK